MGGVSKRGRCRERDARQSLCNPAISVQSAHALGFLPPPFARQGTPVFSHLATPFTHTYAPVFSHLPPPFTHSNAPVYSHLMPNNRYLSMTCEALNL
jgi:hypothetical protein